VPAQQQTYDDQNPPISQGVQIWGEGPEIVPYAAGFIPPSTFLPGLGGSGSGSVNGSGSGAEGSDQLPDSYDLHWVAGDTVIFEFFFADVCWVPVNPNPVAPIVWQDTTWSAEVRTTNLFYYGYWWPPVWPVGGFILSFAVTAVYIANDPTLGSGTMVTLKGGTFWPGTFKWDLQSESHTDVANPDHYEARTWLAGTATVDPQITVPGQPYPPSNWPVYEYP
jgi:hypothetical protein